LARTCLFIVIAGADHRQSPPHFNRRPSIFALQTSIALADVTVLLATVAIASPGLRGGPRPAPFIIGLASQCGAAQHSIRNARF